MKIYAFYSWGGYKDFYVGDTAELVEYTYYIPMLGVMKAEDDPAEKPEIERLEKLPQIRRITSGNLYGLPQECLRAFSHGGYKAMYRTLGDGQTCLAFRSLDSTTRDEEGRQTPFALMFLAKGKKDLEILNRMAAGYTQDEKAYNRRLGNLFQYDPDVNGLRFDIGQARKIFKTSRVTLTPAPAGQVCFVMLEPGMDKSTALREQDLNATSVRHVAYSGGTAANTGNNKMSIRPIESPHEIIGTDNRESLKGSSEKETTNESVKTRIDPEKKPDSPTPSVETTSTLTVIAPAPLPSPWQSPVLWCVVTAALAMGFLIGYIID